MTQENIIICDDEAPLRRMLAEHLGECGYNVTQAENALDLVEKLKEVTPDPILLDVRMPDKDGLTALREIRENSQIPIMMLTAAGDVVDRVLGLEFGADDYLVKPVDLRELQARVKATLRRSKIKVDGSGVCESLAGTVPFGMCHLDIDGARLMDGSGRSTGFTK